ncbi:MAG: transglycosylase SLT domain-containing protein [Oligoflexia bacterium]|nr:transglycosylase SLT domain-containing protein [Oligoflexia bacterium]
MKRTIAGICLLSFIATLNVTSASAAYDHVVTWSDQSALDLAPVLKSQYASNGNLLDPVINDSALTVAITDADHRVNPLFHIPPQIRPSVEFWLKIYTLYTTQQVAVFDSRHPEIVYEVLDFRELAHTARNQVVYEILRERRVKAAVHSYVATLEHLARTRGRTSGRNPVETKILAALKGYKGKRSFQEFAHNLRTQTGQRDNVVKGLLAAEIYFPKMERVLADLGAPTELSRLTLVESSFDLSAYSRTGAQGVWQFMPGPGHKLMLIDSERGIDERLSPLKSTVAAGKMLLDSYRRFNNWALAITSYNHGLKGLPRLERDKHSNDFGRIARLFDPNNKASPLGWAGRNYYAEFLAMVHAEAYRHLFYGEPPATSIGTVAFRRLEHRGNLVQVAALYGVSVHELRAANPDVQNMTSPLPEGFLVALPDTADDIAQLTAKPPRRGRKARQAGVKLVRSDEAHDARRRHNDL